MTQQEAPGRETEGNSHNNFEDINLGSHDTGQRPFQESAPVYGRGVWLYREAGWCAPLPVPPASKQPPPKGFSGYEGQWPTEEQTNELVAKWPSGSNLVLRVDHGLLGIDVDAYDNKTGGQTLKEAESRWGPLPLTYRSSARIDDHISGIRVLRVPVGVLFCSRIDFKELQIGDIEIIQPHHRFITAWPSIHPKTGQRYRWFGPGGELLPEGQVPRVAEIPELPQEWIDALAKDAVRHELFDGPAPNRPKYSDAVVDEGIYRQLAHLADNGAPDAVVDQRLQKALLELTSDAGSRYDYTRDNVAALIRMHYAARVGVPRALAGLFSAYVLEVADTRRQRVAEAEFLRFTEGAALLIAATPPSDPWRTMGTAGAEAAADGAQDTTNIPCDGPSWSPIDLSVQLRGDSQPVQPTMFPRTDGHCLLYPGLVHSFHGESESGKSLIIQAECVRLINQGQNVLYADFDSDVASVVSRLREFGADPEAIAAHLSYVQPEVRPDSPKEQQAWEEMLSSTYALAVIDGVTDALGIFGYSTKDNDDVARWMNAVPKLIAARTGAAVVLIDHVTKDPANRGRWAIGGQAKMAGLTGAAYTVEVTAPLGRSLRGEVLLRIGKDRPGNVRSNCGAFSKKGRTQEAARIVVDSTVSPPQVTVGPPCARSDEEPSAQREFRPTNLMQRVSEEIEQHPGELTKNQAVTRAGGRKQTTLLAFDLLDAAGYLTHEPGRCGHPVFTVVQPYREEDDPLSDRYVNSGNALDKT